MSTAGRTPPRISRMSWGRLELEDGRVFKDAKLYPGGSREWDWTETGTNHSDGIQAEDVQDLLRHGASTIILSRGIWGRLRISPETLGLLENLGIKTHVLRTHKAVSLYNRLRQGEPVGGLFHTTC